MNKKEWGAIPFFLKRFFRCSTSKFVIDNWRPMVYNDNIKEKKKETMFKINSNAKNLILIDCIEEVKPIGQTPLRHQVYTLVTSELKLIS